MTSIEMIVMYSPLIIHSKAWAPMTRAIHLWARRAQNAGFIEVPACDGQRCGGKALLPGAIAGKQRTWSEAVGHLGVPATAHEVVGHRVRVGIGIALDERWLLVEQVVD